MNHKLLTKIAITLTILLITINLTMAADQTIEDFDSGIISANWVLYEGSVLTPTAPGFNNTGYYGIYRLGAFPTTISYIPTINSSKMSLTFLWKPNSSAGDSVAVFITKSPFINYTGAYITTEPATGKVRVIDNALAYQELYTTSWNPNEPTEIGIESVYLPNGSIGGFNYFINGTKKLQNISMRGFQTMPSINYFAMYIGGTSAITRLNIDTIKQTDNLTLPSNLLLSIKDENNLSIIANENFTISWTQNTTYNTSFTTTGLLNLYNLGLSGIATIEIYSKNYQKRSLKIDFGNGTTTQNVTFYMAKDNISTQFTILNPQNIPIENATINQYKFINGISTLIDTKTADVIGNVRITNNLNNPYVFIISANGYITQNIQLNSIDSTSYTVHLQRTISYSHDGDWYNMLYAIQPAEYYNDIQNNQTYYIQDFDNNLTSYGITSTYPGGTSTTTGNNPSGSTLNQSFTITGATLGSTINITWWYYKNSINHTFRTSYYIQNTTYPSGSILDSARYDFGMGSLEKIIIVTILTIIIVAAFSVIGGEIVGLAVGLLAMGIFTYIINLSFYFIIPGLLIGVLIISKRTT